MSASMIKSVVEALRGLRCRHVVSEYAIHGAIEAALRAARIEHEREVKLGKGMRIDFLCECGIGIEVKKGKVGSERLRAQAERYAGSERIEGLVLVIERNVFRAPDEANGKPVVYISLSKNWGIAL